MNPRERAQQLVRLAADDRTPHHEAAAAARALAKHLAKNPTVIDPPAEAYDYRTDPRAMDVIDRLGADLQVARSLWTSWKADAQRFERQVEELKREKARLEREVDAAREARPEAKSTEATPKPRVHSPPWQEGDILKEMMGSHRRSFEREYLGQFFIPDRDESFFSAARGFGKTRRAKTDAEAEAEEKARKEAQANYVDVPADVVRQRIKDGWKP